MQLAAPLFDILVFERSLPFRFPRVLDDFTTVDAISRTTGSAQLPGYYPTH